MNIWSYGKDRSGGIRTIFCDGCDVGWLHSGDAISLIEELRNLRCERKDKIENSLKGRLTSVCLDDGPSILIRVPVSPELARQVSSLMITDDDNVEVTFPSGLIK